MLEEVVWCCCHFDLLLFIHEINVKSSFYIIKIWRLYILTYVVEGIGFEFVKRNELDSEMKEEKTPTTTNWVKKITYFIIN